LRSAFDEYHDGYALSCLWAFEQGRALYSEIFPLRSFEFFVGLLGRRILPDTVEGYHLSLALLKFLPVAGVCLLSLVWTRSLAWSFAAGLLSATLSRLDPRQGMQVFLVAVQLGLIVSRRRSFWWMALPCGAAACVGYDALVMLVAATTITGFLVPSLRERSHATLSVLPRRLRQALLSLAVCVLPFSAVIAFWQGTESVRTYWQLLFDYSRHLNAAYGIRLPWNAPEDRHVIVGNLLMLSLFAATTACRWKSLSPRRQRAWCFLTVVYFLALHRGLGRSDAFHLRDSIFLTFALGSVGLFELLRIAHRNGFVPAWPAWRNVVLLVGVLAAWSTKHASRGPLDLVRFCSSLSSSETLALPRDDYLRETVLPNETIWAIEQPSAYFANQRHGPTRHPLAHCIGSPSEQRRAVADLRDHPPRLVLWPASVEARTQWARQLLPGWERREPFAAGLPTADVMIGVDTIPSPLRYFIISQHVLRHFRPADRPGYLLRAEPEFSGFTVIPPDLNGPLRCGRLPLTWAASRWPLIGDRIQHTTALTGWEAPPDPAVGSMSSHGSPAWVRHGSIDPRATNYLFLTVTARRTAARLPEDLLTIQFDSGDPQDQPSEATLFMPADGQRHSYLLPIGCSPAWAWRSRIASLALVPGQGTLVDSPTVTALMIDDIAP
ncbi:MAG TPA: hypothetical protein VK137_10330, partial [Planctomycetaceae bacterium]|nr:hypothetical protein [Planctomycetaceae bacterium]